MVVDDGSTDATAAVAARFHDKRIRLIRQSNSGVSAARNAGIAAVLAGQMGSPFTERLPDALMFLDGDDWLAPDALGLLAETLENAPWAAAAVGRYARVDSNAVARLSPAPAQGMFAGAAADPQSVRQRRASADPARSHRGRRRVPQRPVVWRGLGILDPTGCCWASSSLSHPVLRCCSCGNVLPAPTCPGDRPGAYRPALKAIYGNPGLAERLGTARLAALARRAEAEMAWTVGRELIRHGRQREGLRWLGRSFRKAPSLNRLMLMGLSRLRFGPFRPYRTAT